MTDKKKILIIDDDPAILESVKAILEGNGYNTATALNGAEGLEAFKTYGPDLVLCDMMMEKIDEGINVARTIKETNKDIPVFLLSSIGDATAYNMPLNEIGFNGEFQKPVDFDVLLSVIDKHLQ